MQELIRTLKGLSEPRVSDSLEIEEYKGGLRVAAAYAKGMLEKEKALIEKVYWAGGLVTSTTPVLGNTPYSVAVGAGGAGGNGGELGAAGSNGTAGGNGGGSEITYPSSAPTNGGAAGTGGAAGKYINGISNVTLTNNGTVAGNTA